MPELKKDRIIRELIKRTRQNFEGRGICSPSEEQLSDHAFYKTEKNWFAKMTEPGTLRKKEQAHGNRKEK